MAAHIDIPIIILCLIKYCRFSLKAALKVVGIYLLLVVVIPFAYDELTSEPLGDTIEMRTPGGQTIELKLNEQSDSSQN
ncbi:hypothetical protein ACFPK9_16120 [Rubritalea spongiae]|uniref:hypothetical protein n=1 Tax=Rubritalea spongiae TaxID=430797 RepID=UPI00361802CE